jgi:large subunit ribosomal protein L23
MIGKPKKTDAVPAAKEEAPKKVASKKAAALSGDFKAKNPTERDYATIVRPVVTEKATQVSASGTVVFEVSITSTKSDIRDAVQNLFKVKVVSVNTTTRKGKNKVFRGRTSRRGDIKLAYVKLAEGQNIDVAAGI